MRPLSASLLITTAALAAAVTLPAAAGAARSSRPCPPQRGTLAVDGAGFGRVWHRGASLYACTTVYGTAPRSRRLGPWAPSTRVSFDGVNLAWTVPMRVAGRATDRVWAGSAQTGKRWMLAQKPDPGGPTTASREGRVQRILAVDRGIAWVTKGGAVVAALESPAGETPEVVGPLPAAPVVLQRRLLLLGRWPGADVARLGASLRLIEEDGDGDECGGVNPYVVTVRPDASAPRVGARWQGYWSRPDCG